MKLLLDTHIFLWLIKDSDRLSNKYRKIKNYPCRVGNAHSTTVNFIFVSISYANRCKYQTGKLKIILSKMFY